MKWLRILNITVFLVIATPTLAETGIPPNPEAVDRGQVLYEGYCQQCHGVKGVGEIVPAGILAPDFIPAMPLNETSHAWHHGDKQLVQIIQRGNERMPPFGQDLDDGQLRDVVAYIKSLWSARILACQGPKHMSCL